MIHIFWLNTVFWKPACSYFYLTIISYTCIVLVTVSSSSFKYCYSRLILSLFGQTIPQYQLILHGFQIGDLRRLLSELWFRKCWMKVFRWKVKVLSFWYRQLSMFWDQASEDPEDLENAMVLTTEMFQSFLTYLSLSVVDHPLLLLTQLTETDK